MCEHKNTIMAFYPEVAGTYRVLSLYVVYCRDCGKFVNLLSGEEVVDDGLHYDFNRR